MAQAIEDVAGDEVMIMRHITAVMSTPRIVRGHVSTSGKTILVPDDHGPDMRLDATKIMSGDCEFRSSYCLQLYSPEAFQKVQRANYSPIPGSGSSHVSELEDLPSPSHEPMNLSSPDSNGDM